jgi:hypothetical protein
MSDASSVAGSRLRTRRALLFGGLAAAAGVVGEAVARARPASAADGDPVLLGAENDATSATEVKMSAENTFAFIGEATAMTGLGAGMMGSSRAADGTGLFGFADHDSGSNNGLIAHSRSTSGVGALAHASAASGQTIGLDGRVDSPEGIGVRGRVTEGSSEFDSYGVFGTIVGRGAGVRGEARWDQTSIGVLGESSGVGTGIVARNPDEEPEATALRVEGQVRFSTAGFATIPKGTDRVTVDPGITLTNASKILCTLQSGPGGTTTLQRIAKNAVGDVFTIILTGRATAATRAAWFVIA